MEVTLHHQLGGTNNALLSDKSASRLVRAAFGIDDWQTLDLKDAEYNRRFRAHPLFRAFLLPPEAVALIPEWGDDLTSAHAAVESTRVLATVDSSAPFDSTNIPRDEHRRTQSTAALNETTLPPSKRRKVQLSPLYHLIDQPHQYFSPEPSAAPSPKPMHLLPEHAVRGYLQDGARDHLRMRHKRVAWIVPIRGKPSTAPKCTAAAIAPTLSDLVAEGTSRPLLWRKETARAFWDFLIRMRKQQVFGQLGIAYEPGADYDYIKVYHSASYSLRLRTALDSFRNEADVPQKDAKAYRPLKCAVLLLVDEVNRGLLFA